MIAHLIVPGETLTSVAAADGLNVAALAQANGLSPTAQLTAGTTLMIPPQTAEPAGAPAAGESAGAAAAGSFVVAPGDTLTGIAANAGLTVTQLADANGLNPDGVLLAGSTLIVPAAGAGAQDETEPVSDETESSAPSNSTAGSATPAGAAQPTAESISAAEVGQIAAANGVPPALAEAIAYDESGFNNDLVSGTGAVGVMQIEPATWRFIEGNLAPPPPLLPASAADNVRAGVLLLRSLLDQTAGNVSLAVAGYYQGLRSVLAQGMFSDTRQYVATILALEQQF
ncbi:MAG: lytic transglycosylase [Solirubrobacteraceae bacterium]